MSRKKDVVIALSAAAGLLLPCADLAFADYTPVPVEAVEKAKTLIAEASEIGASAQRQDPQGTSPQDEPQTASNAAGFEKFLKIKNLCIEKSSDGIGLSLLEGSRKTTDSLALSALLSNFSLWNLGETPVRKAAASSCLGPGDYCTSSIWCCGALSCRGGVCSGANGGCIPRGRPCSSSIWCCCTGICGSHGYCQ